MTDLPTLTVCSLCGARTAAMPGPRNRRGRPLPPAGYEVGYIVELKHRAFCICAVCLNHAVTVAA